MLIHVFCALRFKILLPQYFSLQNCALFQVHTRTCLRYLVTIWLLQTVAGHIWFCCFTIFWTGKSNTQFLPQNLHYFCIRPRKNIGLFAKIRPGEILFLPTRRRKLPTFYSFKNQMKDLLIIALNYF